MVQKDMVNKRQNSFTTGECKSFIKNKFLLKQRRQSSKERCSPICLLGQSKFATSHFYFQLNRKNKDKKTAQSRVKHGKLPVGTLAIGKTTAKRVSAFNSTRTLTSTKACGRKTSVMVRERSGATRTASYAGSTQATGSRIGNTVVELSFTRMATDTTVIGFQACHKEKAE